MDQLQVWTFPVVLGKGKTIIPQGAQPGAWEVTDSAVSGTGVSMMRYAPKGPIRTGSFALDD